MLKVHKCKTGRTDVVCVKEDSGAINIKLNVESSFGDKIVDNITFCPFCGVNLRQMKG